MKLSNFKKYAGPVITRRAEGYLAEGRVDLVAEAEGNYQYLVHGTYDYEVFVSLDGDEILEARCDCPYAGMCKHVTAALMDIKERQSVGKGVAVKKENPSQNAQEKPRNGLGLTEDETFVLCYMAFSGQSSYVRSFAKLPQGLAPSPGYTQTSFLAIKKSLGKGGWLRNQGNVGAVNPSKITLILLALVRGYKDWLKYFEKSFRQPDYILYLTDVARVISGESVPQVHFYRSAYHYYGDAQDYVRLALLNAIAAATPAQMGVFMDDRTLCDMGGVLLYRVLESGYAEDLKTVGSLISQIRHASAASARLYSRYRLATFYSSGEELPSRPSSGNYHETFYLAAAKALLGGDAAESISLFQQGLKIQNKTSEAKNIPDDNVSFFLYTVALSIRRNAKDVSTLGTILRKRNDFRQADHALVFPLVAFSHSTDQTKDASFIRSARGYFTDGHPRTQYVVAALTACFFGMKADWKQPLPDPKMLILRKECEHYFPEALSEPCGKWPYEAVLPRIPIRPAWELQIEELLQQVGHNAAAAATAPQKDDKRLYYLVDGYYSRRVEVREQGRLASGAWSKGKKVSLLRYRDGDCPMDEVDKKIYAEWLKGDPAYERYYAQSELPSFELILPYLVGTDKLATDWRGSFRVVDVKEEKPFIRAGKSGGEIRFGTNVPSADCREFSSMFVHYPSPHQVVIYPMPSDVMPAYRRILEIGHLPAESEPMLGRLFEALKGRLEIHSDISGGLSLPKVDGVSQIVVRITPDAEVFALSALVRPLEGGSAEFVPGEGDAVFYDSRGGERVEVRRDLRKEASNLRRVNSLLSDGDRFPGELLMDAAELLEFMDAAADMSSVAVLEWPEGEPLKLRRPDTAKWEINAVGRGGWYELEGELAVSDDKVLSVGELLSLLRGSKGRYVRLGEKEYMILSEGIRKQLARLDYASQEYRGKLRVPELALAAMGDQLSGEIAFEEPDAVLEIRERIRRSRNAVYEVPTGLNATLRYYQEEGFQWLMRVDSWGAGACLADDMGLGKTVQAIAFMLSHAAEGPSLVVAPASVVTNWQRELSRFAPSLRAHLLSGLTADSRGAVLDALGAGEVLILTYGLLASEAERLSAVKWNVACLDEAHTIKNRDTKTSGAAMKLEAAHRLILTGTPVQNHLGELWNLFRFINPGLLGTYEQFAAKYMTGGGAAAGELKRLVAPFLLRRTKGEVVRELPDKEEIVVPVTLSEDEMAVYEVIRREAVSEVSVGSALSVNALSMITKLRMAACSASLAEKKWIGGQCSKMDAFLELLIPIVEGGNAVLVFSQFTSFLSMAVAALEKAGISDYLYLDGRTPATQRQKLVDSFQRGSYKVFFISLKAGGLGLNLTGANYVIHLDPWWNPAIEQQATDRAYRIGQSQKVTVYHLISSQTIEEKILRLHSTKRSLADSILEGTSSRLTPEEILEMIR